MIFRSAFFSRRDHMDEAAFEAHWVKVHGALASKMPGVHKYLQNHIRERLFEIKPFPDHAIDAISQQWFDDIEGMERCELSAEYAAVKRDIENFQGAITILVLDANSFIDNDLPVDSIKLILLHRRHVKVPIANPFPDLNAPQENASGPTPFRVVENVVIDRAHPVSANVPQGKVPVDTMTELWFSDRPTLLAWFESKTGRAFIHEQSDLAPLGVYIVEEIRII